MSSILLAHMSPPPYIITNLFTVPVDTAYVMCDLLVNSASSGGLIFNLAISLQTLPTDKDYIAYFSTPPLDENGNILNIYKKDRFVVARGESVFIYTSQTNINVRLSGYSLPFNSQVLNVA
jgi:hypothetical protein